jgi:beta-phosphoglucomutase-like phosphatase (HAD superfamily)
VTAASAPPFPRGAIFDVDGVLVDSPHEKAWRESLAELMESEWSGILDCTTWSPEAFTSRVYEEHLSGKPRLAGASAALEYFHIPDDEEGQRLLQYAERKQEMVVRLIEAGDFTAYPDALRFIIGVKDPVGAWRPRHHRRTRTCFCAGSGSTHSRMIRAFGRTRFARG